MSLRTLLLCCCAASMAESWRQTSDPRDELPELHIAGLFHREDWQDILAFRAAVDRINMDKLVLPHVRLVPIVEIVSPVDSFSTGKRLCNITRQGVSAVFGPKSSETLGIVTSICETLEIPHILTHWETSPRPAKFQINIHPDPKSLSQALVALLDDMAWRTFTIIYENDDGLVRLQEVLKVHGPRDNPITVRQLGEGDDYRPLLKEIHNTSESRLVLDVSTERIVDLFLQARQVKMMGDYTSYLVTSLDAHTLNFSVVNSWITDKRNIANITGMRLVDPTSIDVQNAVQDWVFSERLRGNTINITPEEVKTSAALMYDAVHMFAKSLHRLNQTAPEIYEAPLQCDGFQKWEHGERLITFMKMTYSNPANEERGMTGLIALDPSAEYRRTNFTLTLVETNSNNATGTWNMTGIHLFRSVEEMERSEKQKLSKKLMRVVSRLGAPYLMKLDNWTEDSRNDGLEGYAMDLIHEISLILNFKYEFYLVKDGKYGSLNPTTKQWDGIIKDLLDRKADLGICDLTITYDRERAVDFTMPFMNLGISILFSKPQEPPPNLFSFLSPLSLEVWIYMATAYVGVSLLLFVLARTSPYEWDNPHPCNPNPEELQNTFTLFNSMWFAMGSFLQQGCDFLPKAVSTRMVAGMWWFFTLIMISSYTANLAAFLTVNRMDDTITSAKDLAQQNKIKYGCIEGGSTQAFFKNSNFSDYQRMWAAMEAARPSVFPKSNAEGVDRVLKSKRSYAYLMESSSIEYEVERHCELMQIGNHMDSKGYGIAMPMHSWYRTLISGAVLKLQESGKLAALKEKWWKQMHGGGKCQTKEASAGEASANELGLDNVGGVFVVLISGCAFAFLVAVLEFILNTRKVAIEYKISPKEALLMELKFALRCRGTTKPVHPNRESTPSSADTQSVVQLNNFKRLVANPDK
ncbi:glutamate receptor ionotropic, kainate 2-like isoform X1 [Thrips palmi]|uniref:Glutamate receptor 1 n=1 Tax=Thrips palmi TaxID=161013 RepID=A0A6P9A4F8_THRPL|nr:glutamate receptor ionotropic, kainate 2-like isoform X1 [Thrips palmi]